MYTLASIRNVDPSCLRAVRDRLHEGPIKLTWYENLKAFMESEAYQLDRSRAYVQKMRNTIRKYVNKGRFNDAVHQAHRLYKKPSTRLVAAADAIRAELRHRARLERSGKRTDRQSLPTIAELAAKIDDPSVDPAVVTWKQPKRSGGFREMVSFALVDRARQHLVKLTFGTLVTFDPCQAGVGGNSWLQALAGGEASIRDPKFHWGCEVDLVDFFNRVPIDTVARRYKLPRHIVTNILTLDGKEARGRIRNKGYSGSHAIGIDVRNDMSRSTRRRLPTGSSISPIFAYGLLEPALREFRARWGERVGFANCNDNFLILAEDKETLKSAINFLRVLVRELAAFELTLAIKRRVRSVEDGIDFLGHRLRRSPGREVRTVSYKNKVRLNQAFEDRLKELNDAPARILATLFGRTLEWVVSALSPFRNAPGDYHRLMFKYARQLKKFAAKHGLLNSDWAHFAEVLTRVCPRYEERLANVWPGSKVRSAHVEPSEIPRRFRAREAEQALFTRPREASELDRLMISVRNSLAAKYGEHSRQVLSISNYSGIRARC